MAKIIEVLSRDDFIFRNCEYEDGGFVINDKKLTNVEYSMTKEVPNSYFWYLLFLRRIAKFYGDNFSSLDGYKNFSDDISNYQIERIKADELTDYEKIITIPSYYIRFSVLQPILIQDLNIWERSFADFIIERQASINQYGLSYGGAAAKFISAMLMNSEKNTSVQELQVLNF